MTKISGDQQIQSEGLEGLATADNHRRWFVQLALPYLADNPIEIGSGLGDDALEWADHVPRFTATEAAEALVRPPFGQSVFAVARRPR